MKYYAGLDVSVKETSVCIVDEKGKICRERKVVSHPDDLVSFLSDPQWHFERVGLEAGPLSQWLYEGLAKAGFPAICIETRHTKAFLNIRGLLRNFGLKVGMVGAVKFEDRIRELIEGVPDLAEIVKPLLAARRKLREEFERLDHKVREEARIRSGLPAIDDGARRWPNRFAGIRGDNRHSGPIPILAGGWSCSRIDADSQPVGRE